MPAKFPDEIKHLDKIIEKLQEALNKLNSTVSKYETDFRESMKYLWQNKSDMDSMEIFSNEKSISQTVNSGEFTVKQRETVKKLIDSPYFARIDFRFDGETESEPFYIGRFSFVDNYKNMLIYDWRAPVSSMYYDFELGSAFYSAPTGVIEGEMTLKRQFKIKNSIMEYALESSISINDEVLQKELNNTTDQKMKNIVATIQREQNKIIRNENSDVLVIQGVAGSGKTSIALHRVAFFLYKYKERLMAQNISIISPNKVFADYISNVLPELGEEPITEVGLDDIAEEIINGSIEFEGSAQQIMKTIEETDDELIKRVKFKGSQEIITLLEEYMEYADENFFSPCDFTYHKITISKDFILERYNALKRKNIAQRLEKVAGNVVEKLKEGNRREGNIFSKTEVLKKITSMFRYENILALYKGFYDYIEKPKMFVFNKKLETSDVFPYIYLKILYEGVKRDTEIQHIVIDEMQDYTPIQYAVINKFYKCRKTILGDFGQSIHPYNSISKKSIMALYKNAEFVELTKSYRSTFEIIEFARKIQSQNIDPIERHGDEPQVIICKDWHTEIKRISDVLEKYQQSGFSSIGIVCKKKQQIDKIYKELSDKFTINLLDYSSTKFKNGITITTVHMAKGLEFDEVIVPHVNQETYQSEFDRGLLYVACTRAMHKLTLTCNGQISSLLSEDYQSQQGA